MGYITQKSGLGLDSPEGIAAQIIWSAHRLSTQEWHPDTRDKEVFKLGRLCTLYKVYGLESATNTKNSGENRRRQWAELLAADLVKNNPNAKFPALWEKIPEEWEAKPWTCDGYNVCRARNQLCVSSVDESDDLLKSGDHLRKDTFRTQYIAPAKKNHREKFLARKK